MTKAGQPHFCEHGNLLVYVHGLKGGSEAIGRKGGVGRRASRKPLKRGKGMAASPEQRKKVRNLPCVVCGQSSGFDIGDGGGSFVVDPAHLLSRASGGCEHADCVVPLCRADHRAFDHHELDLLPALVDRGYFKEMAHMIEVHELSPFAVVERLTNERLEGREAA